MLMNLFCFFSMVRLPELREILLAKDGFTAEEASKLLDMLVRKFDANGDGKFNYKGKPSRT
jgi:hypothetical protein